MLRNFLLLVLGLAFICLSSYASATAQPSSGENLSTAALEIIDSSVIYDSAYSKIPYPNGDVSKRYGVCSDVVIRAYRRIGIDLQKLVHEDMAQNFSKYPKLWGLKKTDTNIDHRRVPNLQLFFARKGKSLPVSQNPENYKPGDVVTWNLNERGMLPHIGIVTTERSKDGKRPLVVHNIGHGQNLEDMLFSYTITGHYQYP